MRAKRASLREAIEWIALNDDPGAGPCGETISVYISTMLVADIFGLPASEIARMVCKVRVSGGLEKPDPWEGWLDEDLGITYRLP